MTRSDELHEKASRLLPGGVSSPARAFGAVGGHPLFASRGEGAYIFDADGRAYIDYVQGFGSVILGHADERVAQCVSAAAGRGGAFGLSTEDEIRLAALVTRALPSVQKLRFVATGTEAAMTAARLARAATGRAVIVKFEGCYHGHADVFLAMAGSSSATFGIDMSAGVTDASVADTIVLPFNDIDTLQAAFHVRGEDIAAVFIEPVPANMGVVLPEAEFLLHLLRLAREAGGLVVFDEVVTGFRLGLGGAQGSFGLAPDLTLLGKVVGGGLPLAAVGGRGDVMDLLAPTGPVFQAGTYAAHPHAVAAGLAVLEALEEESFKTLETTAGSLADGLAEAATTAGATVSVTRAGTILSAFFRASPPASFDEVGRCDLAAFARFHAALRQEGVLIPPSQFEAWFPSLAHGEAEVERTIEAARRAFRASVS